MNINVLRKTLPAFIPYITITIGLLLFHNAWLAMLGYHAGIVVYLVCSKTKFKLPFSNDGAKPVTLVAGFLAGAVVSSFLYLCWPFLSIPEDIGTYLETIGLTKSTWPVFLVYFIIVNPMLEEYFWRYCISSTLKRPVWNDVLFAGYHLLVFYGQVASGWLILVFLGLTAGAWFWRQLNRINGGILASYISHLAADIIVILTIFSKTAI
jgi:membrane protease YdiL (CAAX protease family)